MQVDLRDTGSIPGAERCPGGGHSNLLQYSCLENPMDRAVWWATVRGVEKESHNLAIKKQIKERQVRSLGQKDPLEEGIATPSSILAWRIPWTEEPGRLQSTGVVKSGTRLK